MLSVFESTEMECKSQRREFSRVLSCGPTRSFPKSGERNPGRSTGDIRMEVIRYGLPRDSTTRCNWGVVEGVEERIGSCKEAIQGRPSGP
jgi:hypothetical protein